MQLKLSDEQSGVNPKDEFDRKKSETGDMAGASGDYRNVTGYEADEQGGFAGYEELQKDDFMEQFEEQPYVSSMPEPAKKSFKEKASIACILVIFVSIAGWCLLSGLKGLIFAHTHSMEEAYTNLVKGDVYEGQITYISPEFCELKHTINLIPAGTEHFYLMFSEDGKYVVPIRASKKWDNQYAGDSIQTVSLQEKGMVREMDYKVRNELSSIVTAFQEEGIRVEPSLYIDLISDRLCILQIIVGISLIVCVVYFFFIADKKVLTTVKGSLSSPAALFMTVLFVAVCIMSIYLLNMA